MNNAAFFATSTVLINGWVPVQLYLLLAVVLALAVIYFLVKRSRKPTMQLPSDTSPGWGHSENIRNIPSKVFLEDLRKREKMMEEGVEIESPSGRLRFIDPNAKVIDIEMSDIPKPEEE